MANKAFRVSKKGAEDLLSVIDDLFPSKSRLAEKERLARKFERAVEMLQEMDRKRSEPSTILTLACSLLKLGLSPQAIRSHSARLAGIDWRKMGQAMQTRLYEWGRANEIHPNLIAHTLRLVDSDTRVVPALSEVEAAAHERVREALRTRLGSAPVN